MEERVCLLMSRRGFSFIGKWKEGENYTIIIRDACQIIHERESGKLACQPLNAQWGKGAYVRLPLSSVDHMVELKKDSKFLEIYRNAISELVTPSPVILKPNTVNDPRGPIDLGSKRRR